MRLNDPYNLLHVYLNYSYQMVIWIRLLYSSLHHKWSIVPYHYMVLWTTVSQWLFVPQLPWSFVPYGHLYHSCYEHGRQMLFGLLYHCYYGHLYHSYCGHFNHMIICTIVTMDILTALPTDWQTHTGEFRFLDPSLPV